MRVFLAFISLLAVTGATESPVTCISDNTLCEVTDENFIDGINDIHSVEQCRQLCLNNENCKFLIYYEAGSFPMEEFCYLFSTCETTLPCEKCVSETFDCQETCSSKTLGPINNSNFIDLVPHVQTEQDCKKLCVSNKNCQHYTYFLKEDSENSKNCFLLTALLDPQEKCQSCMSGPGFCQTTSTSINPSTISTATPSTTSTTWTTTPTTISTTPSSTGNCFLNISGEIVDHKLFNYTWNPSQDILVGCKDYDDNACNCELRHFLVGGGGDRDYVGCGAGSGYHNYEIYPIIWVNTIFGTTVEVSAQIAVGNYGQASNITLRYESPYNVDFTDITAHPGQDATYDYHLDKQQGGNGYSGGGGFCDKYNDCSGKDSLSG